MPSTMSVLKLHFGPLWHIGQQFRPSHRSSLAMGFSRFLVRYYRAVLLKKSPKKHSMSDSRSDSIKSNSARCPQYKRHRFATCPPGACGTLCGYVQCKSHPFATMSPPALVGRSVVMMAIITAIVFTITTITTIITITTITYPRHHFPTYTYDPSNL